MSKGDEKAQRRLQWLLDAPLFVDEALTARLFDAVVRPSYEVQSREVGEVSETARRRLLGGEAEAGYDLGLSFLTGALKLRGQVNAEREKTDTLTTSTMRTEVRVDTAGRRLEEIALVYLSNHPDRIVFIDTDGTATTFDGRTLSIQDLEAAAEDPPRMLAFIDIPATRRSFPWHASAKRDRRRASTKTILPSNGRPRPNARCIQQTTPIRTPDGSIGAPWLIVSPRGSAWK